MRKIRKLANLMLIGYTACLSYWMLFAFGRRTQLGYRYNLSPLETIRRYMNIDRFNTSTWIINLVGNIGVFIPFGIIIPLAFDSKYRRMLVIFLSIIFTLEVLQLVTRRGSFDIDDFILNSVGATIGYCIYKFYMNINSKGKS